MGKGAANPVEQWRKKEKKKLQKRHTEDKIKARSALLMQKEPDRILADIRRIQWAERQGTADPKLIAQKKRLLEIHKNVSEKKQLELERREKEQSVVVKGLTKILSRPASKPATGGDNSKVNQELQELMDDLVQADDDGILALPPNLAPPRAPAPAPWSQEPPPTHIWQPHGPPLPFPGPKSRSMAPSAAPAAGAAAPSRLPPVPSLPPLATIPQSSSGVMMESAPALRAGARADLCTVFTPTNMLLNARRRQAAAVVPAKRRNRTANVPKPLPGVMESAEKAYDSFLSEIEQ